MSVASGEKNIHPTSTPLHDVMRKIWNDHTGDPCHGDRFCICLMPFVNCGILSPEFLSRNSDPLITHLQNIFTSFSVPGNEIVSSDPVAIYFFISY